MLLIDIPLTCTKRFAAGLHFHRCLPAAAIVFGALLCMPRGSAAQAASSQNPSDNQRSVPAMPGVSPLSPGGGDDSSSDRASRPASSTTDAGGSSSVLPAEQIVEILQSSPDLLFEVKNQVADRLQQQGMQIQASDVSDDMVYRQISFDYGSRAMISQLLKAQGYAPVGLGQEGSGASAQPFSGLPVDASSQTGGLTGAMLPNAGTPRREPAARPGAMDRFEASNASRTVPEVRSSVNRPSVVHQQPPYDLQSLRDLYTQIPNGDVPLRRFGSEIFINRTISPMGRGVSSADARLDVPLGPDYVIAPGDALSIDLWGGVTQHFTREVSSEGAVLLPEAGALQVAGLPLGRAESMIRAALTPQYRNLQVAVTLSRIHSVRVYVVGDVQRPGGYDISSLATPLSALYAAGGPTASGSLRLLRHYRGQRLVEQIDLYDFLLRGIQNGSARFQTGDTLQVPPAGTQIAVSGAVRRPAIYELTKAETHLATVIEDAGGATVTASLGHITIDRIDPHRGRTTVTLKGADDGDGKASLAAIANFTVQDGDRIQIAPILPYSARAVYLEGHVSRPGKLPYTDGMKLSDVLHSYRDLLPEPAARGEVIRLVSPDLHAETIDFDVADVLVGNSTFLLQSFDTIRVFGRYQVDAPSATVHGEVLRPGTYPLSQGMTAADLVRMAGGFRRDALREEADLVSYQVQDGSHVDHQVRRIAIGPAVDRSDARADVPLKPGDILTVHQITGWGEIGESVTITGQVRFPGSYGFREGDRLSSVLRRAGSMRDTAYPEGAVLIREQVRELEENSRQELIRQIETNSSAARLSPALVAGDTNGTLQLIKAQQEQAVAQLKSHPASGRMVIRISADIDSWANTPADIELRAGDVLTVPKRPGFVLVTGQVYNATALTFTPDKTAGWYLSRAGGTNGTANRKDTFIIRANGSVVGRRSGGWFEPDVFSTRLYAGDVVVVPQKIIGASLLWRNLLATAQIASSIAITAGIATAAL